jgi:tetratricopeptide (TPR) repeat protein
MPAEPDEPEPDRAAERAVTGSSQPMAPRPRRPIAIVAAGVGVVAAIVAVVLLTRGSSSDAPSPSGIAKAPVEPRASEPVAERPSAPPEPAPEPEPERVEASDPVDEPSTEPDVDSNDPTQEEPTAAPTTPRRPRRGANIAFVDPGGRPLRPAPGEGGEMDAVRAAYSLGNQRLFAGDTAGAIRAYRQTLWLAPKYAAGHRQLGLAYAERGEKASAVAALQKYLALAPNAKDAPLIKKRIRALQRR